jgi:hypothetical protein
MRASDSVKSEASIVLIGSHECSSHMFGEAESWMRGGTLASLVTGVRPHDRFSIASSTDVVWEIVAARDRDITMIYCG